MDCPVTADAPLPGSARRMAGWAERSGLRSGVFPGASLLELPPAPRPGAALSSVPVYGLAMQEQLLVVHVEARVKPEAVESFRRATLENAARSREEPGVVRFDVVQDREDATRFVFVEVYRGEPAAAAHKETAHYRAWRDAVAPLMAEPRRSRRFAAVSPDAAAW